jgi:CRISPR-associated protein Csa3
MDSFTLLWKIILRGGSSSQGMDTFINAGVVPSSGVDMGKVLIATIYNPDAVLVAAHRLSPNRLFLLVNEEANAEQDAAVKKVKESLGLIMEIKTVKVSVYDIVKTAAKAVELIDAQPNNETIYVNVTSGRKTQAFGLLFAAYARADRVKKIAYNPEEDKKSVVYLPRLSFNLNNSQKKVLDYLAKAEGRSIMELAEEIDISRAMLYKVIQELKDQDLIETEEGVTLTDAGRIARL